MLVRTLFNLNQSESFMAQVKLNLRDLTIPQKVQKARQIVTAMTGNANFTTPDPALAAITTATDGLEAKYNEAQAARDAAKARTDLQDAAARTLDQLLASEGSYVQNKSGGDAVKIQSAGMDVRDAGSPVGELPAPGDINATEGDHDGEIDLHWNRAKGAKSYVVQRTTTPTDAGSWGNPAVATKSKITIAGLTTGTKYYFRVAGIGAAGQGGWSELASKVAP